MLRAALSELELIRRGQMADLGGDKADVRISTKDARTQIGPAGHH
jgi:hypothetical protein